MISKPFVANLLFAVLQKTFKRDLNWKDGKPINFEDFCFLNVPGSAKEEYWVIGTKKFRLLPASIFLRLKN